jgi:hypothetical protein
MLTDDSDYFTFGTQDENHEPLPLDSQRLTLVGAGNQDILNAFKYQIQFWITERQCVPAFLSTVTLELMEKFRNT